MHLSEVAILMRTRNRPQMLMRAIASVVAQTFCDWHIIIINDGGDQAAVEDATRTSGAESKITVIHHTNSRGMAAASNSGIAASKSTYIALLDDDDTWEPTFLAEALAVLYAEGSESKIKGVATYTNQVSESITGEHISVKTKKPYPLQPPFISLSNLLLENQFTNLSFLYRRDVLDAIGCYDEEFILFDDWEFNIRFASHSDIAVLPRFLANYHMRLQSDAAGAHANNLAVASNKQALVAKFRDILLRRDLQSGKLGVGTLMHLANQNLKVLPERFSLLRAFRHDFRWLMSKIRGKLK